MIERLDVYKPEIREQGERIVIRLSNQGKEEIVHVLKLLFPNAKPLGLSAVAELLTTANNPSSEFMNLVESELVAVDHWETLSGTNQDAQLLSIRSSFDPTKFEIQLTCARTPLKEFFPECTDKTCESCIQGRLANLKFSTPNPWTAQITRLEKRRVDLCKNCGQLLSNKDDIYLRNERLVYKCHYCGHKGWNPAK